MTEPRADVARIAAILREHRPDRCWWKCDGGTAWSVSQHESHVAGAVAVAMAPDIDKMAQAIWEMYAADTGRALPAGSADRLARAAVAAMVWHPEERTITTMEQLDALPRGSLVRANDGDYWERLSRRNWDCLSAAGTIALNKSEAVELPATLLWHPEDRP